MLPSFHPGERRFPRLVNRCSVSLISAILDYDQRSLSLEREKRKQWQSRLNFSIRLFYYCKSLVAWIFIERVERVKNERETNNNSILISWNNCTHVWNLSWEENEIFKHLRILFFYKSKIWYHTFHGLTKSLTAFS